MPLCFLVSVEDGIVHLVSEFRKYYLQGMTTYVIICGNENYVE